MGRLEERIVDSLVELSREEPGRDRGMFVFPTSLMGRVFDKLETGERVARSCEAVLFCRPDAQT